jgi:recombination protein RecA
MPPKKKKEGSGGSFEKFKNLIIDPTTVANKFGYWSTGSTRIDNLLNGGLTKGRMSEFVGKEQSGKSTVCLSVAREVIKLGGRVLYIDLERGLEIRKAGKGSWLEINGIDAFDGTFDIIQQNAKEAITAEDVYDMMIGAVRDHTYQYIVVDSMAAFTTRSELAGDIGDANMGAVARINSQGLKTLFALQGSNMETSITFINQVRDQLQGTMGGLKSTGGKALPHYCHQRLRFDKADLGSPEKNGDFIQPIRVRCFKSRGASARETEIFISAHRGIDVITELFEAGIASGLIEASGSWYTIKAGEENVFKAQGKPPIKDFIKNSPDIYDRLYEIAASNEPVLVAEEAE